METKIIVLILTLAMPNGDSSISVEPMETADVCVERAEIEAADPFVASVECAMLTDGRLELQFSEAPESGKGEQKADASVQGTSGT